MTVVFLLAGLLVVGGLAWWIGKDAFPDEKIEKLDRKIKRYSRRMERARMKLIRTYSKGGRL